MKSILIYLSMMWLAVDGACIKLQNFNTSKGDLEGAYLNGVFGADGDGGGVGDLNYFPPVEGFLTKTKNERMRTSQRVPYVDINSPYNWVIRKPKRSLNLYEIYD